MNASQDTIESSADPGTTILAWEDDPGEPGSLNQPANHPLPDLDRAPLPSKIAGAAPEPSGETGTAEFRYWTAADALRRSADFWGGVCGGNLTWHSSVGSHLTVTLDADQDLNAYYDRQGLSFFYESVDGQEIHSGESPDVVCHEFGHAVLDALQPRLWAVYSFEAPALHESFGDMSAMLCALQLPEFRRSLIASTGGVLNRTSRLSRLAEQLGWGIRQGYPDAVDPDCLRSACNSFFYQDPLTLPPRAPASNLSSEPHSFSRVFTAAFLNVVTGMFFLRGGEDSDALGQVSLDAGRLLAEAARSTPVCVPYFSQFAAHMIAADRALFNGAYAKALKRGFVSQGVLALPDATSAPSARIAAAAVADGDLGEADVAAPAEAESAQPIALSGNEYGFDENLLVHPAGQPLRFNVSSAAPEGGPVAASTQEDAAAGYVEDLFRRGHVIVDAELGSGREVASRSERATHEVRREEDSLVLARRRFHCGWPDPWE
jgi:hypothetical protein